MTLSNAAYKALEDIVGPNHVSREPVDLDSYCFVWGNELLYGDKFSPRPLAVILPGNTEEISADCQNMQSSRIEVPGTCHRV